MPANSRLPLSGPMSVLVGFAMTSLPMHGAIVVPDDAAHVIKGTVEGTLIAIDVPTLALPQAFTTEAPGGPLWTTGTPPGTIAHPADNGFHVQSTVGDDYTGRGPHNRAPWEPDGTPLAEGGHYGAYNGTDPEVSYLFNLADSGIDIPDGAVIHAVYTTWNTRLKDNADFAYAEGADAGSVNVPFPAAPADDLVLRWYDDADTGHDADFQRIIAGPITVTGGDGFRIDVTRQPNTAHIDAVIIDVSGATSGAVPFAITGIDYDADTDEVTLTWTSKPGETYGVYWSTDMIDWSADLNDSVDSADPGDTTSATFDLTDFGIGDLADLFFRVERN